MWDGNMAILLTARVLIWWRVVKWCRPAYSTNQRWCKQQEQTPETYHGETQEDTGTGSGEQNRRKENGGAHTAYTQGLINQQDTGGHRGRAGNHTKGGNEQDAQGWKSQDHKLKRDKSEGCSMSRNSSGDNFLHIAPLNVFLSQFPTQVFLNMCFVQPFVTWWWWASGVPQLRPRSLSRRAGWLWRGRSWAGAWWSSGGIWRLCWASSRSYRLPRDPLEPGREKILPLSEWASNRPTLSSTLHVWIVILGKALCFFYVKKT